MTFLNEETKRLKVKNTSKLLMAVTATTYSLTSLAHSPDKLEATFFQGLMHPITGLDHLLAMILIGLCIGVYTHKHLINTASFLVSLLVGMFMISFFNIPEFLIEIGVIGSLLTLGYLVTHKFRLSENLFVLCACAFALFHGFAHVVDHGSYTHSDLLANAPYITGVTICTGVLLTFGLCLSRLSRYDLPSYSKLTGILTISFGGILLAQLISK